MSANFVPFSASPPRRVWVRASFRQGSFPWCAWPAYLRNKILYNGNSKSEKDHEMALLAGVRMSVASSRGAGASRQGGPMHRAEW
ncbi:MAG TPA: hypothetical protein VMY43_11630 [Methanothrix sp.]|nr:hypothetical protein [Methanothrix sp.]